MSIKFQLHAWLCAVPAKLMQELIQKQIKHPFNSYSEKAARETLLSFFLRVLEISLIRKTQPLSTVSAPKYIGTHLSFIPVCCLVHGHCWVNRCQLISICLHPDPTVEPQRQEIVHNLQPNRRRHWSCTAFMDLFALQYWLSKDTQRLFQIFFISRITFSTSELGTKRHYYNWGSNSLSLWSLEVQQKWCEI